VANKEMCNLIITFLNFLLIVVLKTVLVSFLAKRFRFYLVLVFEFVLVFVLVSV